MGRYEVEFCNDLEMLISDQAKWSQETFGTDSERGPIGALKHLEKEAKEAYESYGSLEYHEELADCFILLLDAIRRSGLSFRGLVRIAITKMIKNKARAWPKPTSDEPVEHIRD
jgi:hypothetical protein